MAHGVYWPLVSQSFPLSMILRQQMQSRISGRNGRQMSDKIASNVHLITEQTLHNASTLRCIWEATKGQTFEWGS